MTHQDNPSFYQQVEDFIIDTVIDDISEERAQKAEIGMFLLSLLSNHKKEEAKQNR